MGLKDLFHKSMEKSKKFKEMDEDLRLKKILEDRQKSPNERELEKFFEKKRKEKIKLEVHKIRKIENDEFWRQGLMKKENMFKGHQSILHSKNMFGLKGNIL